jgi:hypothetical protein
MKPQMLTLPTETRATESPVDIQEQVRRRAFELHEERGRDGGHDLDDWLQAESELVQQRTKAVAASGGSLEILAPVEFSWASSR